MHISVKNNVYFPQYFPMNFSGKLTAKIVIKDDYVRADGTSALYLQIFLNKEKKKLPLNISVKPLLFDKVKQRLKSKAPMANDYNLLIEKSLADIAMIEVNYRLSNEILTMEKLIYDYYNPSSRTDFVKFWENEMEHQKAILDNSTYKQQMSALNKLKGYAGSVMFYELDQFFFDKMVKHFEKKEKNAVSTVQSFVKNFKKYLHIANDRGIRTPLHYKDIHKKKTISNRTFLNSEEITKLHKYYHSDFINENIKPILARFLFSCFTGLRISDIIQITTDNIVNDILIFNSKKTGVLHRIQINETALSYIGKQRLFENEYTEQHINRELKEICKHLGIKKRVSFHVARHTFATNFLICGGRVEVLQKLLGHSNITETMIYVHIVDSITDELIHNMNSLISNSIAKLKPLD